VGVDGDATTRCYGPDSCVSVALTGDATCSSSLVGLCIAVSALGRAEGNIAVGGCSTVIAVGIPDPCAL